MATLTPAQVAALVKAAGFPESVHVTMVAICRAESGYRVEAIGGPNRNGTYDRGLFQINDVHKLDKARLTSDATYNTEQAKRIYDGQGLKAWSTYSSGAYQKYTDEARQGVAQAASATGSPVLPGSSSGTSASTDTGDSGVKIFYGPMGGQFVIAGIGSPLTAAQETLSPLQPLKILGSEMWGDISTMVIGAPTFEAGIETIPNLKFTIADPGAEFTLKNKFWSRGLRVQYADLNLRIDQIAFEPGGHGSGQVTITAIDDAAYGLKNLRGPKTIKGTTPTFWLASELDDINVPSLTHLLGEAMVSQNLTSRDVPDAQGSTIDGEAPSAWTTVVRLAQERGKRFFISGTRVIFGSSAFAMRWCAPGSLRLSYAPTLPEGERWLSMPTSRLVTVGWRSYIMEITGRIPLSRALFFRPGVSVMVRDTPAFIDSDPVEMMCASVSFTLGTDVDGAEITLIEPVDPPPKPPQNLDPNDGNTAVASADTISGGDGQIDRFVSIALTQAGKRYVFGAEASPSDPDPRAFDCSELVQWAAARAGITPAVPDGSANQRAHCTPISVPVGVNLKGALLFQPGHVAISLGNGRVIEAANPKDGVRQGSASRDWSGAGRIPGAQGYR